MVVPDAAVGGNRDEELSSPLELLALSFQSFQSNNPRAPDGVVPFGISVPAPEDPVADPANISEPGCYVVLLNTPPANSLDPKPYVDVLSNPPVVLDAPSTCNRHRVVVMNNLDPTLYAVVLNAPPASNVETWHRFSCKGGLIDRKSTSWQHYGLLGSGSCGEVYKALADDGFIFAVKEVPLSDKGKRKQLEHEISLLSRLKHKNIVRYLGQDKDEKNLYLFLEFMSEGSLSTVYHKHSLEESLVATYARQILEALEYLHGEKVMHRDIKCANILVNAKGTVKLADFGMAKDTKKDPAMSRKGTPHWMAPEVITDGEKRKYGLEADIWSLGCTVLEMFTGKPPFYSIEPWQAWRESGTIKPPRVPDFLSDEAQNFINTCLQVEPGSRCSAAELLDYPFVKK